MSVTALERHTMEVDGSRLSYTVCGRGQPLVLIHGWAGFWEHILSMIRPETGFQFYAFDMPGWHCAEALDGSNTLESFDAVLYKALKKLGLEKVHLMGQSMGAISALLFADRHPDLADRLVLASPPFSLLRDGPNRRLLRWGLGTMLRYRPLLAVAERTHKSRWYNYWMTRYGAFYRYDPWFFEEVIMPSALVCDEKTSISHTVSMLDIDVWSIARRIPNKTAIIVGDRDPVVTVESARTATRLFRDAQLFVIPRAKHAIMMEKAVEFCEITFRFLEDRHVTTLEPAGAGP